MVQCFVVNSEEARGRLDPDFHLPKYKEVLRSLDKSSFDIKTLDEISKRIVDGPFGSAIKAEDYVEKGIPFIRVADVTRGNGTIKTTDLVYISEDAHKRIKRSRITPGDIVVAKTGATMGATSIVPNEIPEGNIRGDLAVITINDTILSEYVVNYINSRIGQLLFWRQNSGATRGRVIIGNLKTIPVLIPPKAICLKVNSIMDTAYKAKREKEAKAKELLDGIDDYVLGELGIKMPEMKEMMCYTVNSEDVREGRIDAEYHRIFFQKLIDALKGGKFKITPLGKVCKKVNRRFTPEGKKVYDYIQLGGIGREQWEVKKTFKIQLPDIPSRAQQIVQSGEILFSLPNPQWGVHIIINEDCDNFIVSSGFSILKTEKDIDANFVVQLLRSNIYKKLYEKFLTGAGLFLTISEKYLMELPIPLPDLPTQEHIATEVQSRMNRAKQLRTEAKKGVQEAKKEVERILLS